MAGAREQDENRVYQCLQTVKTMLSREPGSKQPTTEAGKSFTGVSTSSCGRGFQLIRVAHKLCASANSYRPANSYRSMNGYRVARTGEFYDVSLLRTNGCRVRSSVFHDSVRWFHSSRPLNRVTGVMRSRVPPYRLSNTPRRSGQSASTPNVDSISSDTWSLSSSQRCSFAR